MQKWSKLWDTISNAQIYKYAPSTDYTTQFIKPVATAINYMLFMALEFGDFSNIYLPGLNCIYL